MFKLTVLIIYFGKVFGLFLGLNVYDFVCEKSEVVRLMFEDWIFRKHV